MEKEYKIRQMLEQLAEVANEDKQMDRVSFSGYTAEYDPTTYDPKKEV